jgi:predicted alpha/beta superfamily hydrolase
MGKLIYILFLIPTFSFGQMTKEFLIHSKELKCDRRIWVNTPEHYEFNKDSLQLVFLLDGNNKSLFEYTVASKRFLEGNSVDLADYKAPQSIIVGIEQAENRWDDFGDSIKSQKFLSFLEKEIIPYTKLNYRTVDYKILIGHSLGGRFAIKTLLIKPNLFNAIISASPAFEENFIERILLKFDTLFSSRIRFDKALFFSTTYIKGERTEENFRKFSETLEKYLKNKNIENFRFRYNSSNTLGHGKSPFFSIPEGLHFIYDPSLWQLEVDSLFNKNSTSLIAVKNYEKRIKNKFGIPISIQPYVSTLTYELLKSNKTKEAIELFKSEINKQPTDINLFAQLLVQLKKNKMPDYKVYELKFLDIFKKLKISQKEKSEWMGWIDQNSR